MCFKMLRVVSRIFKELTTVQPGRFRRAVAHVNQPIASSNRLRNKNRSVSAPDVELIRVERKVMQTVIKIKFGFCCSVAHSIKKSFANLQL